MTSHTPTPQGFALVLVLTGVAIALAGSIAALATANRPLMGIAAVGFAMQFAGWVLNGRRNGGAR
ncbi:hypothetical protein [Streptomyces himalayensis]|uniref:Uncharacterized protein n=1 Tax=Streptomyces himalayensis subsp. himalayensis TaxID=2756131 RepID=A0A7W0DSC4_9ACTN|nr:hypothetical protein [Streptomyces himalayensis]MBA2950347.1 hypothetical protein [Streptomyces himalayensis subsp. himalayensis]